MIFKCCKLPANSKISYQKRSKFRPILAWKCSLLGEKPQSDYKWPKSALDTAKCHVLVCFTDLIVFWPHLWPYEQLSADQGTKKGHFGLKYCPVNPSHVLVHHCCLSEFIAWVRTTIQFLLKLQNVHWIHHKLANRLLGEHTFNHTLNFSAHHQLCWPRFDPSVHFNNSGSGSVPQVMVHISKVVQCTNLNQMDTQQSSHNPPPPWTCLRQLI